MQAVNALVFAVGVTIVWLLLIYAVQRIFKRTGRLISLTHAEDWLAFLIFIVAVLVALLI